MDSELNASQGGGVVLYIRDNISFKVREDLTVFKTKIFESLFIETVSDETKDKEIVGIIYRIPGYDITEFTTTLLDILEKINDENLKCTLMGDFNIDLMQFSVHNKTNIFIDGMFSLGYLPQITKPTRIDTSKPRISATLIDHIYTNNISNTSLNGIIHNDVAAHRGLFSYS